MQGFSLLRLLTSTARWLINLCDWPFRHEHAILLSPPFLRRQLIYLPSASKRLQSIESNSYFDWATIHEIFIRREYSLQPFRHWPMVNTFYQDLASTGKPILILDLGANVGVSARYFVAKFPEATVACVEAAPLNYPRLRANLVNQENVAIYEAAISSEMGQAELFDNGLGNNAFQTFGKGKSIDVIPATTVGKILEDFPGHELFMVKVDIEGFEAKLFESNFDWIDRAKVIAIETHDWMLPGEAISANFIQSLSGRDRDLVFRGENLFSIRNDPK